MSAGLMLAFAGFAFASSITPGPNNAMLLASGVNYGFRRTVPHIAGISLGCVAILILVGLGLGQVFAAVPLIYGVLHIINFAHGALLTCAMFAVWGLSAWGVHPYAAAVPLALLFLGAGYALQRLLIGAASGGSDNNALLVTLGLSIVIENALLAVFRADTRVLDGDAAFQVVEVGPMLVSAPRLVGFALLMPLIGGTAGLLGGQVAGLSPGGVALMAILAASASYIAVPAAMRLALPRADAGIYVTLSVAVTFPFNILVGIPLWLKMAGA